MTFAFLEEKFEQLVDYLFRATTEQEDPLDMRLSAAMSAKADESAVYLFATIEKSTLSRHATVQPSDSNGTLQFYTRANSCGALCPAVFSKEQIAYRLSLSDSSEKRMILGIKSVAVVTVAIRVADFAGRVVKRSDAHFELVPPLNKTKDPFAVIETELDCKALQLYADEDEIRQKIEKTRTQNSV